MKLNLHCLKRNKKTKKKTAKKNHQQKTNKRKKKRRKYFPITHPPTKHYTFPPSFYYVMQLSDVKVVQFKRKILYIIPGGEFFTT